MVLKKIYTTKYYKFIIVLLCIFVFGRKRHRVAQTFVLANTCLVGEKAKIVHFISKNKIFFFLYKRVYHFPHHHTTPQPPTTTTHPLHQISQNHQPQQNYTLPHPQPLLNHYPQPTKYTTLQNHKTNQPSLYHNPLPPKKPTK